MKRSQAWLLVDRLPDRRIAGPHQFGPQLNQLDGCDLREVSRVAALYDEKSPATFFHVEDFLVAETIQYLPANLRRMHSTDPMNSLMLVMIIMAITTCH